MYLSPPKITSAILSKKLISVTSALKINQSHFTLYISVYPSKFGLQFNTCCARDPSGLEPVRYIHVDCPNDWLKTQPVQLVTILCRKKDGDWYIYPQFLVHDNFKNVYKNVQKCYKTFKPRLLNVLCTGTNIINIWLS